MASKNKGGREAKKPKKDKKLKGVAVPSATIPSTTQPPAKRSGS